MSQLEIDITPTGPDPGDGDPKTLREWLFARLLMSLEAEAEEAEPTFKPESFQVPAGAGRIVEYYEARARAMTWRQAARLVRNAIRGREGYLIFDRANSHLSPPSEAELECARHHDACTVCMSHEAVLSRMQEEINRLEAVRVIYVGGIHDVFQVSTKPESTVTLAQVVKYLERVSNAAYKRWQKRLVQ